mgnify:CR=1 FL=1
MAAAAFLFVVLGVRGLAAAQFGLSDPGMGEARLTGTETRPEPGEPGGEDLRARAALGWCGGRQQRQRLCRFRPPCAASGFRLRPASCARRRLHHERNCASLSWRSRSTAVVASSAELDKTGERWPTSTPAVTLSSTLATLGKDLPTRSGFAQAAPQCLAHWIPLRRIREAPAFLRRSPILRECLITATHGLVTNSHVRPC